MTFSAAAVVQVAACNQQDLTVRLGVDWDESARNTFESNFKGAHFLCRDIRELTPDDLVPFIPPKRKRPILFGACAPYQPFSKQNRHQKRGDGRRTLLSEFHRFVSAFRPDYLFVENVPELHGDGRPDGPFHEFIELLDVLGYWHTHDVVIAYHYGVPQRRRRLILIASAIGPIGFPERTHGPNTKNFRLPTVWDRISSLPAIKAGETHPTVPNHRAAALSAINLRRIIATPRGGSRADWPKKLELDCHHEHSGHTDVYGRMLKNQPAPALTTRCISLSNGRFGHPTQNRAISVREAACIQTFPMGFVFRGNLASMARQIGNAVPVELARVFGRAILNHYRQINREKAA